MSEVDLRHNIALMFYLCNMYEKAVLFGNDSCCHQIKSFQNLLKHFAKHQIKTLLKMLIQNIWVRQFCDGVTITRLNCSGRTLHCLAPAPRQGHHSSRSEMNSSDSGECGLESWIQRCHDVRGGEVTSGPSVDIE